MSLLAYHLTAAHLISRIKREGLRRGALPWNLDPDGTPVMKAGFQWLTTNPNFAQPWCLLGNLPYARNSWRITVLLPTEVQGRAFKWSELARRCRPDSAEYLDKTGGDTENWYVFHGRIRPQWFLEVARNPGDLIIPEVLGNG